MRTLKKALSLVLVLALLCSVCVFSASATNFTDDADIEYTEAVDVLVSIGVIDGMGDGTFNPKGNLTRAQASKIICYLLLGSNTNKLEESTTDSSFTDVIGSGHDWASPYIEYCVNAGIVGGYGDGTFGPGDQLTGFQFAKMLLCALGYDAAIEGYTGSAWTVAVASDIIDANLDAGLPGGFNYNAALTRDEACQMAFNWLKADMVEYDTKGTTIVTGDGTTVVTGASTADPKANPKETDGNIKDDGIMQAAEYYFPDLKQTKSNAADDFGRPANTWKNANKEVGTYTDKATQIATYDGKVDQGTLASLVGKAAVKDLKAGDSTLTVYVDGVEYDTSNIDGFIRAGSTATFASQTMADSNRAAIDATGNGSKTEVYMDKDNNVNIVVINEYLVKAAADYNANKDVLKVELMNTMDINGGGITLAKADLSADDFPAVADALEDDFLVVTLAAADKTNGHNGKFNIMSAEPAKIVNGTVDTFTKNVMKVEQASVTIDGQSYNYALLANGYDQDYAPGEKATVVTDANGYVLFVAEAVSSDKFVFVYQFAESGEFERLKGNQADVFFVDGTDSIVDVASVKAYNPETQKWEKIDGRSFSWYSYTVDADGKYKLKLIDNQDYAYGSDFSDGKVLLSGKTQFINASNAPAGTTDTVTIIYDYENDDTLLYNGAAKVPDVTSDTYAFAAWTTDPKANNTLKYVFVFLYDGEIDDGAASDDLVYLLASAASSTDSNGKVFVPVAGIKDGAMAEVKFAEDADYAAFNLVSKVKTNSDGYATGCAAIENKPEGKYYAADFDGAFSVTKGTLSIGEESLDVSSAKIYLVIQNKPATVAADLIDNPGDPADLSLGINANGVKAKLGTTVVQGYMQGVRAADGSSSLTELYITVTGAGSGDTPAPAEDTYSVKIQYHNPDSDPEEYTESSNLATVTATPASANEGDQVTLSCVWEEDAEECFRMVYTAVDATGAPVTVDENGTFTMPASDVTVTATFTSVGGGQEGEGGGGEGGTYSVTVNTVWNENYERDGTDVLDVVTVTATPASDLKEGDPVTLSGVWNEDYSEEYCPAAYTAVDATGAPVTIDENGTFTMPASDVTVTATVTYLKAGE